MMGRETTVAPGAVGQPLFATTHWSDVLSAANRETPEAAAALERLCRTYWYPLYAYVRHRGHSPEDSQDLTQEFFYRLLRKNYLAQVDPRKGRFRSFLMAAVNHFLSHEWERARALKRGGKLTFLSLDALQAEQRYLSEPSAGRSPEELYDEAWAGALLQKVLERLREENVAAGQATRFEALKGALTGEKPSLSYAALTLQLGTTEPAVKKAVQRLRKRYAELLREEITHTLHGLEEVEDELKHLRAVLSSQG